MDLEREANICLSCLKNSIVNAQKKPPTSPDLRTSGTIFFLGGGKNHSDIWDFEEGSAASDGFTDRRNLQEL